MAKAKVIAKVKVIDAQYTDVYEGDPEVKALVVRVPDGAVVVIENAEEFQVRAAELVQVKADLKSFDAKRAAILKPFKEGVEKINEFFAPYKKKLEAREAALKVAVNAYLAEEAAKLKAEQKRLEDIAQAERVKLQQAADAAAAKAREAAEEARQKVLKLEREGRAAEAEKARQKAAATASVAQAKADVTQVKITALCAPVLQRTATVAPGLSQRKVWKWKVVDLAKVPRECLCVDSQFVNAKVAGGARSIDGIEIYEDTIAVSQSK